MDEKDLIFILFLHFIVIITDDFFVFFCVLVPTRAWFQLGILNGGSASSFFFSPASSLFSPASEHFSNQFVQTQKKMDPAILTCKCISSDCIK